MCNSDSQNSAPNTAILPYFYRPVNDSAAPFHNIHSTLPSGISSGHLDHYRLQLYNYAYGDRFRYTHPTLLHTPYALGGYSSARPPDPVTYMTLYGKLDPRLYRIQEEPKPQHSYIGLIAMAILSNPDKKMVLSDIYQYILDNYSYFRNRGPGWRNSIRHNLSLNDCFMKSGRSANGKGHYWAIHPANLEDFKKGDFRRRKAQRKVRKHMGLAVPDEEDSPSPPPVPSPPSWAGEGMPASSAATATVTKPAKKRQFDMASILALDDDPRKSPSPPPHHSAYSQPASSPKINKYQSSDEQNVDILDVPTPEELRQNYVDAYSKDSQCHSPDSKAYEGPVPITSVPNPATQQSPKMDDDSDKDIKPPNPAGFEQAIVNYQRFLQQRGGRTLCWPLNWQTQLANRYNIINRSSPTHNQGMGMMLTEVRPNSVPVDSDESEEMGKVDAM